MTSTSCTRPVTRTRISTLTNLRNLNLDSNELSGSIPPQLGNLANLQELYLFANQLSGAIPPAAFYNLDNLRILSLHLNNLTDISELRGLNNLTILELRGNPLSVSSINDHIPALERSGVIVLFDQLRESDFDIELVFLDDHFAESQKRVIRYAARRWMSILREDLPDYTFSQGWSGQCGDQSFTIPSGERIDDLRIYVIVRDLDYVRSYRGGVERTVKPVAQAGPRVWRETHLPIVGCMEFDVSWGLFDPIDTTLHEIGHVLGIGTAWSRSGFLQDSLDARHFNGPLAIAAFDDAGGRDYTGAKVPVEPNGWHWRTPVLDNELMSTGSTSRLSAITVQALADLGYVVDVTQADPYTLPDAAAAKVAAFHPQAEPQLMCGVGTEREPIYVVDPQGQIIRTLNH